MFELGDLVTMKKSHACGQNRFEVIRLGADIKICCMGCGHIIMMPRRDFSKRLKKIATKQPDVKIEQESHYVTLDQLQQPKI
ncbi:MULTISPECIES: DUF951 domain-containing protein [Holzapfeliella]